MGNSKSPRKDEKLTVIAAGNLSMHQVSPDISGSCDLSGGCRAVAAGGGELERGKTHVFSVTSGRQLSDQPSEAQLLTGSL